MIVDPSHAAGRRSLVPSLATAGVAAGADGLIIEVHDRPEEALSDGPQSLTLEGFAETMRHGEPGRRRAGPAIGRIAPGRRRLSNTSLSTLTDSTASTATLEGRGPETLRRDQCRPRGDGALPGSTRLRSLGSVAGPDRATFLRIRLRALGARDQGRHGLIGFCGLAVPNFETEFTPAVEIGWRLGRDQWGNGYATEAAQAPFSPSASARQVWTRS